MQLERLAGLGCEIGQGWLWERALEQDRATAYVIAGDTWTHVPHGTSEPDKRDGEEAVRMHARSALGLLVRKPTPQASLTG